MNEWAYGVNHAHCQSFIQIQLQIQIIMLVIQIQVQIQIQIQKMTSLQTSSTYICPIISVCPMAMFVNNLSVTIVFAPKMPWLVKVSQSSVIRVKEQAKDREAVCLRRTLTTYRHFYSM